QRDLRLHARQRVLLVNKISNTHQKYEQRRKRKSGVICQGSAQTLSFVFQPVIERFRKETPEATHGKASTLSDAFVDAVYAARQYTDLQRAKNFIDELKLHRGRDHSQLDI